MRVLVLECALSLDVNAAMIADYADVARRHGDLSLTVLTREGVRDRLAGGVPEEVELLEEVPDYFTPGAVERRAMELLRNSSYDLLFAPREGDVVRAARIREKFGIEGQDVESARAYRDKLEMKRRVAAAGLDVWPSYRVDDAVDFWNAVDELGYPLVLKSRSAWAGETAAFVYDESGARQAASDCFGRLSADVPAHSVAEPMAGSVMYHVDGVRHDGEFLYLIPSQYYGFGTGRAVGEHVGSFGSVMLDPASAVGRGLVEFVEAVVAALPNARTSAFHAEVWGDVNGRLQLNEIAARAGGHFTMTNAGAATGLLPDKLCLGLATGMKPEQLGFVGEEHIRPVAGFGLPYRAGRVVTLPDRCELPSVLKFVLPEWLVPGATIPLPTSWFDTIGDVTLTTPTYDGLRPEMERVVRWAEDAMKIQPDEAGLIR
ncbi:hypothetical protein AB0B39_12115 [Micromonospora sp. NPDC049114]|uniref:ATP-grasp domain-containing protein n=1 Tax=Micromonospora sp. NPDC049114 TaxID=3155498 RepID=UPI0033DEF0C8